jgi:hypothetical protein
MPNRIVYYMLPQYEQWSVERRVGRGEASRSRSAPAAIEAPRPRRPYSRPVHLVGYRRGWGVQLDRDDPGSSSE